MATAKLSDVQIRIGPKPGDPLLHREPELLPDGVLQIGAASGPPHRYLPEGYGPALATSAQLQQLSEDLQALRGIAATDEDLAAEVADIQATIDALVASGATDSELSAAIGPIQAAIELLASEDEDTATAIAAVQAAISGLDQTYATDAQLAQAASDLEDRLQDLNSRVALIESNLGLGLDPVTTAFVAVAQISSPVLIAAIDQLVKGLKIDNIWSLIEALYPMTGGNGPAHRLNLKNPAQHLITWSGSVSHTAMGAVSAGGGNGQGLTTLTPTSNEVYIGLYVSQSLGPSNSIDFAARQASGLNTGLSVQWTGGGGNFQGDIGSISGGAGRITANTTSSVGYRAVSRRGTEQELYVNSVLVAAGASSVTTVPNQPYSLFNGPSTSSFLSSPGRTYAAAVVCAGLNLAQHIALYGRLQTFQKALGRDV
jgi:hypothetical protein